MTESNLEIENVLKGLEQEEQIKSLTYLVNKLPDLVETMKVVEDKADFLVSSLTDHQSLSVLAEDAEQKVKDLQIDKTHFDALLKMTHMLPRLVPMMKQIENVTDFLEDVATDKKTVSMLIEGFNDIVPVKDGAEIIEEANQHFEKNQDTSTISVFGLMGMIKDPTVQTSLKYTQSLLTVINQRNS